MRRRDFLIGSTGLPLLGGTFPAAPPLHLVDVTNQAGIQYFHNTGAFGRKYLPETLGPGCAFLDYDNDGWQDILIMNGMDWPGRKRRRSTLALYRNNRNGTFTDVTRAAGLDFEFYGLGVAVGDYDNDGFPDLYLTGFGQNRLMSNTGRGSFVETTKRSGLGDRTALSTSALWFDYDRDGHLDLFVCNYVRWTPESDVSCKSMDGQQKSYCTPEAFHGTTCWLFRNRGDGTFEDVTAKAGCSTPARNRWASRCWISTMTAGPTSWSPTTLSPISSTATCVTAPSRKLPWMSASHSAKTEKHGAAWESMRRITIIRAIRASSSVTSTMRCWRCFMRARAARLAMFHHARRLGRRPRRSLGFGCFFFDATLAGRLDLLVVNGHIDDTVRDFTGKTVYAQRPQLFLQDAGGRFRDVAADVGGGFADAKVGRGAAYGDFDNDGDLDVLITTNGGRAFLYRNDLTGGNRSLRLKLIGTKSNRDAIGARVDVHVGGTTLSRMVKSGSSYLSQSELPLTFGMGHSDKADRVVIQWPSGRTDELRNLKPGKQWTLQEGQRPR